ncbi:MAG: hydroxymethylbilane synthase [Acidobacteria bacterium]|nr:hydroxymethylbilane synthase [Acidobacteriota bacterium]
MSRLRLGTRGSPLALWQANRIAAAIAACGGPPTELVVIRTSGDRPSERPLAEEGGKRLFVKEIEEALLDGRVDLAVHSAKDLPADRLPGLAVAAVLERGDPHDGIVLNADRPAGGSADGILRAGGIRVGTGSIRRTAQLRHAYPELDILPIRGNVGTRLRKLDDGQYDALILAAAGLERLDLAHRIAAHLPFDLCLPAPGQGILAAEYRGDDTATRDVVATLADAGTVAALTAERTLVEALGADCRTPLGAMAAVEGDSLRLRAIVAAPDGSHLIRQAGTGSLDDAAGLGARVARALLEGGAGRLLRPLAGRRVLITRPHHQAADFADALRVLGAEPVIVPMIRIVAPDDDRPLAQACADAASFDWIVFTSANGVEAMLSRLPGRDRRLGDARIVAVGPATAARLAHHGIRTDVIPKQHRAEAAAEELIHNYDLGGARILLPRASLATRELPDALREAGATVTDVTAYRTMAVTDTGDTNLADMLARGALHVVTFTSPSAVRTFVTLLGGSDRAGKLLAGVAVASIGPVTTAALEESGLRADIVPETATVPALAEAIARRT